MILQSKLLVAKPILVDPVFSGKVVFVAKYDPAKGAEGFMLNGPPVGKVGYGEMKPGDEMPDGENIVGMVESGELNSVQLYVGGPCRTAGIFMVHGYEEFATEEQDPDEFQLGSSFMEEGSAPEALMPGLFFGTPETLARIVRAGKDGENKFRFFTGIAGWSPGQLEREIEAGAWDVRDADPEIIFDLGAVNQLASTPTEPFPFKIRPESRSLP